MPGSLDSFMTARTHRRSRPGLSSPGDFGATSRGVLPVVGGSTIQLHAWKSLPSNMPGPSVPTAARRCCACSRDERLVALTRRGNQQRLRGARRPLPVAAAGVLPAHARAPREDAEDVLQEVFAAAFNAMLADERPINVRPWLYRIARNRSLNHLRRTQADRRGLDGHPPLRARADDGRQGPQARGVPAADRRRAGAARDAAHRAAAARDRRAVLRADRRGDGDHGPVGQVAARARPRVAGRGRRGAAAHLRRGARSSSARSPRACGARPRPSAATCAPASAARPSASSCARPTGARRGASGRSAAAAQEARSSPTSARRPPRAARGAAAAGGGAARRRRQRGRRRGRLAAGRRRPRSPRRPPPGWPPPRSSPPAPSRSSTSTEKPRGTGRSRRRRPGVARRGRAVPARRRSPCKSAPQPLASSQRDEALATAGAHARR